MKALTLTQPWATLVANGSKRIETRSWSTLYRGHLAIHAAKGYPKWAKETCEEEDFATALDQEVAGLPTGCVLAVCRLVSCIPTRELQTNRLIECDPTASCGPFLLTAKERRFGDYEPGRWAWLLADVTRLPNPIYVKGALGLWECDARELKG